MSTRVVLSESLTLIDPDTRLPLPRRSLTRLPLPRRSLTRPLSLPTRLQSPAATVVPDTAQATVLATVVLATAETLATAVLATAETLAMVATATMLVTAPATVPDTAPVLAM